MSQSFAEALSWVPVSAAFSGTLGRAHEYARAQGHRTVTLEHLVMALAEDPDASTVLQASNIDIARLMSDASTHLGHSEDRFAPGQPVDPGADEALIRILDYAAAAARQSRRREINGAIVLAAIVGEARSVAASMLQAQGLTFEGAIRALQRVPAQTQPQPPAQLPRPQPVAAASAVTAPAPSHTPAGPGSSAAAPQPVDPPGTVNGVATQTNEQILASVRRRIDANRNTARVNPTQVARETKASPAVTSPPKRSWDEARPAAPPPQAAEPAGLPEPSRPQEPAPRVVLPPSADMPRPMEDAYSAPYPDAPDVSSPASPPRPFAEDDGLRSEPYESYPVRNARHAAEDSVPIRQPPPLPAGVLAESPASPLRPRQLGAPVAPPSTVPWPEPVRPQPAALPPAAPRAPLREPDPFDGGIAGAPYPEPDEVPPRPMVSTPAAKPAPVARTQPGKELAVTSLDPGQLAETIPRNMQVGRTELVEVRIGRSGVRGIANGMLGAAPSYLHAVIVTKAMSVRLRAVDGGFTIEAASPETQWIDNHLAVMPDDFASWRWNITPTRRGPGRLQLVVSARTIASDGLSAETALPDQVFDVVVQADYVRLAKRAAGWAGLMILGGVLSRLGQGGFETVAAMWRGFQ